MRHHIPLKEQVRSLCAELGDDDCQDPHPRARRRSRRGSDRRDGSELRAIERKACQLCRQVAVTLDEVLAECGDDVLQGLHVVKVVPFPDASRLLVSVMPVDGQQGAAITPADVLEHLEHASGHLRSEVAAAVTRKRAPSLLYRLAEPALTTIEP